MSFHRFIRTLALSSLFTILLPFAGAQEFRGKIQGRVTDTSGAIIPGASVTLLNIKTGVQTVRLTNDAGLYRFDNVDPGSYTITIEQSGFAKFIQENIDVQAQADITVNPVLKVGTLTDTVTVTESPASIEFNTANVTTTVDSKLVNEVPRLDRNPFKLTLLNPAAMDTRRGEMNPFQSLSVNSVELGGGTSQKNDLIVDGSPISIGSKASHVPNSDAVQEVVVQQNSVDAENGHSAGGTISMTLKSGTNEWHGSMFYVGRNPSLNAMTDRTTQSFVASRYHIWGATLGNPIIKKKLFNFFSYEQWKWLNPQTFLRTVPTALEREGDFSQSYNINGAVKTIYDPYSTIFDPATGKVTRTVFAGNKIPANRINPLAYQLMKGFYLANSPGDNITKANNFRSQHSQNWNYWNISDRVDYFLNDKWTINGKVARYHTVQDIIAPDMQSSPSYAPHGSARHTFSVAGDAIWAVNPTTVVNLHTDYRTMIDDWSYPQYQLAEDGWSKYWPNNPWYQSYIAPDMPVINPLFGTPSGNNFYGNYNATMWWTHINGSSYSAKISQARGAHYLKAGLDYRRLGGGTTTTGVSSFFFDAALTADTFNSPNTKLVGNEFASMLLGGLTNSSQMVVAPIKYVDTDVIAGYFQDDWKLSRRISLNLGLRYEYEIPFHSENNGMSRYLDLTKPIPEMQATPPKMPAEALALMKEPYVYNGAWQFADDQHRYTWNAQKNTFLPRVGAAIRINDKTALRVGYARYATPSDYISMTTPTGAAIPRLLNPPYPGFDATQQALPLNQGVPQANLSDPFPAATNPLIPPKGKGYGTYYGLGESNVTFTAREYNRAMNDRFNISFQRQLPYQIVTDFTYFVNFGSDLPYVQNVNMMDPNIGYTNKSAIDKQVTNPFYQYLTPDKYPGPNRNQKTVALKTLLVKYPQYGNVFDAWRSARGERYHALQFKVQRPFKNGYNFMFGYNYNREREEQYFNDLDTYNQKFTYIPGPNPRHRISIAGTLEFPFGQGRRFLSSANKAVDMILGGWQFVSAWYFNTGNFLRFNPAVATGDPTLENPTPTKWFDSSVFKVLPSYTSRENPWQYPDLTGPIYWDMQASLSKIFKVTEGIKAEFKFSAFNLTNRLNRADPDMVVTSSTFGQALRQSQATTGRQLEYSLRIRF